MAYTVVYVSTTKYRKRHMYSQKATMVNCEKISICIITKLSTGIQKYHNCFEINYF